MTDKEKMVKHAQKILATQPIDSIYFKTALAHKNENMSYEYASQICEIEKLKDNQERLTWLLSKTSFQTSITISKYINLLDLAEYVYERGKDSLEFDGKVKEINEFVSSHIVKRPEFRGVKKLLGIKRTTFREVGREDLRQSKISYQQLREQREQNYATLETYMSDLLDSKNK